MASSGLLRSVIFVFACIAFFESVYCQNGLVTSNIAVKSRSPSPSRVSQMKCDEYATAFPHKPTTNSKKLINNVNRVNSSWEFPHMVRIGPQTQPGKVYFTCDATLISGEWLLTAAHCVNDKDYGLVKYARIGQLIFKYEDEEHGDFDAQSYDYKIIEHIIHPNYPNSENGYDIALLRLDREVKFFRPACLAEQFRPENNTVIATGWALSEYENDFNEYLLKFEQKLLSKNECNDVNNDVDYDDNDVIRTSLQTCAESQVDDEKTECDGDSGGPIQVQHSYYDYMYEVVGINLNGVKCDQQVGPLTHTRVFHYLDWIEQIVWPVEYTNFVLMRHRTSTTTRRTTTQTTTTPLPITTIPSTTTSTTSRTTLPSTTTSTVAPITSPTTTTTATTATTTTTTTTSTSTEIPSTSTTTLTPTTIPTEGPTTEFPASDASQIKRNWSIQLTTVLFTILTVLLHKYY